MQGVSQAMIGSVAQGVSGSITGWFARKQQVAGGGSDVVMYSQPAAPPIQYPATPQPPMAKPAPVDLYAGLAFEVHAINGAGDSASVEPLSHEFRTGDKFRIYLRPSMPGRLQVWNINPLGQQTLIENVTLSAAQLTMLGPYQFTANAGQEQLRLVMLPCSDPQLLARTRDIINVAPAPWDAAAAVTLADCNAPRARALTEVRARDITRVETDEGTNYALDPVSPAEVLSGELAPREVTISFQHAGQ
jgi:hypothetical protein